MDELIIAAGSMPSINAHGIGGDELVDHVVISLHNMLGRAKHFIGGHTVSFNASEQYLALRSALAELVDINTNVLVLRQEGVIDTTELQTIQKKIDKVSDQLRREVDPEYM